MRELLLRLIWWVRRPWWSKKTALKAAGRSF